MKTKAALFATLFAIVATPSFAQGDAAAIAKRTGAMIISNFEIAEWFEKQGFEKTHGQHIGGGIEIWFGYVLVLFVLLARPQGLFGEKIIDRV